MMWVDGLAFVAALACRRIFDATFVHRVAASAACPGPDSVDGRSLVVWKVETGRFDGRGLYERLNFDIERSPETRFHLCICGLERGCCDPELVAWF